MKNCIFILMSALWLGGCGPEVLTWDEEVLLNTGEKVHVNREAAYTPSWEGVFRMSMQPQRKDMTMNFIYHRKYYQYDGGENINLLLLAISPEGIPNLVVTPGRFDWDGKSDLDPCAAPHYIQLTPGARGHTWSVSNDVESWLHGMEGNISGDVSYEKIKRPEGVTRAQIRLGYTKWYVRAKMFTRVDPEYVGNRCKKELPVKAPSRELGLDK